MRATVIPLPKLSPNSTSLCRHHTPRRQWPSSPVRTSNPTIWVTVFRPARWPPPLNLLPPCRVFCALRPLTHFARAHAERQVRWPRLHRKPAAASSAFVGQFSAAFTLAFSPAVWLFTPFETAEREAVAAVRLNFEASRASHLWPTKPLRAALEGASGPGCARRCDGH